MPDLIAILGPTASGKTRLAVRLAYENGGEIISADSRQVYRELTIGSGKDLDAYTINGKTIPRHLIDVAGVAHEYNLFEFQNDFLQAYKAIKQRGRTPVLCGGTGLYLDAVLRGYNLQKTPENPTLREELSSRSDQELIDLLKTYKNLHNKTDIEDRDRMLRAIEIADHEKRNPDILFPGLDSLVFGLKWERSEIKRRITLRLKERLENGMLEETQRLLKKGVPKERLYQLGLEYRYTTMYLLKELNYNDMFQKLNASIHAFAKRQMTWFRKMEREGVEIHWIPADRPIEEQLSFIIDRLHRVKT